MKGTLFLMALLCLVNTLSAQTVYTIKADSVKITNCDSAELIIENHTQGVPGFLFNTGNGRTIFKRGLIKLNDSLYLIGGDTLKYNAWNAWVQGGNKFGSAGVLGTLDNNHLDLYTNNTQRIRLTNTGNFLLGTTTDNGSRIQVAGNMYLTSTDQLGIITAAWNSANGNKITIGSNTANNPTIVMGLGTIQTHPNNGYFTLTTPASSGNIFTLESGTANGATICSSLRGANAGTMLQLTSSAYYSSGGFSPTSGVLTGVRVIGNTAAYLDFNPASGNATYNMLQVDAALNTSGTYSGIVRGLYYAPLLKSIIGVDHRAIETVTGNVLFGTSSGNVIIGSTTNNGSKLQVYGAGLINNISFINGVDAFSNEISYGYNGIAMSSPYTHIFNAGGSAGSISFGFSRSYSTNRYLTLHQYLSGSGVVNAFEITPVFNNSSPAANSFNVINISPTWNVTGITGTSTARGIYYNPAITSLTNTRHVAFENTVGDVLLGTTSGNIGIGTNNPTAQLHTTGSVRFAGLTSDSTKTRVLVSDVNGNLYYRDASSLAGNGVLNADLANEKAILPSLTVNGRISAERLKLSQAGWPDYVFARDYDLPKLNAIEEYIRQHGHLPGIPSAAEVEEKGIDVGDHQAVLLKKIEELTLYVITQEKKLKTQEQQIRELQQQNSDLGDLRKELIALKKMITDRPLK